MTEHSIAIVAEMSSFQLETYCAHSVRNVSAILNYHTGSFEPASYDGSLYRCKEKIAKNQTEDDYCVLNYEEPVMRRIRRRH